MSKESQIDSGEQTTPEFSDSSSSEKNPSSKLSAVEVLTLDDDKANEIAEALPNKKNSWLPWKRPSRRDQQLSHLREGYIELLGLVRSISGHLERQKDENTQVNTLVESLPPALNSFEKLATSQKEVTAILGNLNSHMEKTREKDDELLENMQGFNSALKDVSSSNQKSLGTLHKVSERIENSDEQMRVLFEQATQNNQAAGSLMIRLEKRVFLSNLALIVLLSLLLLVGVVWLSQQRQTPLPPPVVDSPVPQTVVTPLAATPAAVARAVEAPPAAVDPATATFPEVVPAAPALGEVMSPPSELNPNSSVEGELVESIASSSEEQPFSLEASEEKPLNFEESELVESGQDASEEAEAPTPLKVEPETTEEEMLETLNLFEF